MNNKLQNNRIHSGSLLLQEYDFEIRCILEKLNIIADVLTIDEEKFSRKTENFKYKMVIKIGSKN